MEMKYYNPSNNFKAPIPRERREPKPYIPPEMPKEDMHFLPDMQFQDEKRLEPSFEHHPPKLSQKKLFETLSQDDLIILGVIFLLLFNSCDDYLLLLALGYIFLSGRDKGPGKSII